MPITGTGILATSDIPAVATVPIYTATMAAGTTIQGFILTNSAPYPVSYTLYRSNLLTVIASGVMAAGTQAAPTTTTVLYAAILPYNDSIWAVGMPGGIVNVEIDGLVGGTIQTEAQMLLAIMLMLNQAFGVDIPDIYQLAPTGYNQN
jgi:hypothetical protein